MQTRQAQVVSDVWLNAKDPKPNTAAGGYPAKHRAMPRPRHPDWTAREAYVPQHEGEDY